MKPSLLACGSYSGEIFLYDLSREDENLIAKSNIDDYYHREIISKLIWWEYKVPGSYDTIYNVLSLATDGKILLWDMRYN
jgi:WD40 repeat protein